MSLDDADRALRTAAGLLNETASSLFVLAEHLAKKQKLSEESKATSNGCHSNLCWSSRELLCSQMW